MNYRYECVDCARVIVLVSHRHRNCSLLISSANNRSEFVDRVGVSSWCLPISNSSSIAVGLYDRNGVSLTKYHVLVCEDSVKPVVGKVFPDLDSAVEFYIKEGFKNVVCMDSSLVAELDGVECSVRKRRRVLNRVGCRARIAFRYASNGTYCIQLFEERHDDVQIGV
nr:protein FAR1-RELATED SEQUENCE 5-like [Ipomoea batatas]